MEPNQIEAWRRGHFGRTMSFVRCDSIIKLLSGASAQIFTGVMEWSGSEHIFLFFSGNLLESIQCSFIFVMPFGKFFVSRAAKILKNGEEKAEAWLCFYWRLCGRKAQNYAKWDLIVEKIHPKGICSDET